MSRMNNHQTAGNCHANALAALARSACGGLKHRSAVMNRTIAPFALALLIALCHRGQAATTYVVDQGGGGDFLTIQAAVDAATAGDTINVNAGTYDEAIVMNKPLSLVGNSSADTIITYTGTPVEQNFFLGSNSGTDFGLPALIENFTFLNSGGLTGDNDLLKFRARGVGGLIAIQNNVFDGASSTDVKAIEESQGGSNFLIANNEFTGLRYGMYLNNAHDGDVDGNSFDGMSSGSIGLNPDPDAAYVPGGVRNLNITNNSLSNGNFGILLGDGNQSVMIKQNVITGHSGSFGAAILYWDDEGSYNSATEFETDNIVVMCNQIYGNLVGIRGYVDPANPPAPQNTINAMQNWWGDPSGPSGLGPGTGDSVLLQNVDFSNWLTTRNCVPEPASLVLVGMGLVAGGIVLRRRRG